MFDPQLIRIYRRDLPHWRAEEAVYFVTWRVHIRQRPLNPLEREQVAMTLRHFEGSRYDLIAYAVMDDHVHVLVRPYPGRALERLVHSWKSFVAHALCRSGRQAPVWQEEYFDRLVRDEDELEVILEYVHHNPEERWPDAVDYPWVRVRPAVDL